MADGVDEPLPLLEEEPIPLPLTNAVASGDAVADVLGALAGLRLVDDDEDQRNVPEAASPLEGAGLDVAAAVSEADAA